jgi:hypothetical protein
VRSAILKYGNAVGVIIIAKIYFSTAGKKRSEYGNEPSYYIMRRKKSIPAQAY